LGESGSWGTPPDPRQEGSCTSFSAVSVIFIVGARSGFKLYSIGIKPLYIPRRFKEAIGFIRENIDGSAS
jgi:hypothetical protein